MTNTSAHPVRDAVQSEKTRNQLVWLNTASVVERIIRDFTAEALHLVDRTDFMAQLDFRCRAMNGLFLGGSPTEKYERSPWNAPDQLGDYVLKVLRINGETRLAVRDAFMVYVSRVIEIAQSDAEFDGDKLEPHIGTLRNALLGMPASPL